MNERECEIELEKRPTDNQARFRLAEIYVEEQKKLDIAQQLVGTIAKADKHFMASERQELLGDRENCDSI